MAARKRLSITAAGRRDLGRIYDHIAAESPTKADSQLKPILTHADMLRDFPIMGHDRSRLDEGLRSIVERPFVVFYYAHDTAIIIARVIHQRQDIEAALLSFLKANFEP